MAMVLMIAWLIIITDHLPSLRSKGMDNTVQVYLIIFWKGTDLCLRSKD